MKSAEDSLSPSGEISAFLSIDDRDEKTGHVWHVHQVFLDSDDDRDFGIMADVDLDATQEQSEAVFENYRVGFIEELLEQSENAG